MPDSNSLFVQLAAVLGLSAVIGLLAKYFRLPLLVGYLLVGVLIASLRIFDSSSEVLTTFPTIGIAFALFFIGMELDLKDIKSLGKPIVIASIGQIVFANLVGFTVASLFGYPQVEAVFLGMGLGFSSTIVIIKLLLEKKDISSLYGKLSIGITVLEDLVAIVVLMGMTMGSSVLSIGTQNLITLLLFLFKGTILFLSAFLLSKVFLKRLFKAVAASPELLFLSAIAWCFVFVSLAIFLGFSVVTGAFLAGLALANSPFHFEIEGKVKSLRDFFVTLFFVYLGSQVVFANILTVLPLVLIFTLYALILKPIIILLILGSFGFRKHTIFQTAINLSQVSEFSLIIMLVGVTLGVVSRNSLTIMALTGVLSIVSSSIMISFSKQIYKKIGFIVGFFESDGGVSSMEREKRKPQLSEHVIVIGGHRMGGEVIKFLKQEDIPFLVVDFNPKVVQSLTQKGFRVLYGDIGDPEIIDFLNLEESRLIISTASDIDDNLTLLAEIKRRRIQTLIITRATTPSEARLLYKMGAEYVILPEVVSGSFLTEILRSHWHNLNYFKHRAEIELNKLTKNIELGVD